MNHTLPDGTALQIERRQLVRRRISGTIEPAHTRPHVLKSFVCVLADNDSPDASLCISVGTRILVKGSVQDYSQPFELLGEFWHPGEPLVVEGATILLDYIEVRDVDGGPPQPLSYQPPRFVQSPEVLAKTRARANDLHRNSRIAGLAEAIFVRTYASAIRATATNDTAPTYVEVLAKDAITAARVLDNALEAAGLTFAPWVELGDWESDGQ